MLFKYPLQVDPFSLWDKMKVSAFILGGKRLTQGDKVREYEKIWEDYTGAKYAVFVNSGSSANFLVAQRLKDTLIKSGEWSKRKIVIFPSLTWTTSITPFLMLGFKPYFIDIDKNNWGLDYGSTIKYLSTHQAEIAAIFPTALLGMNFNPNFFSLSYNKFFDGCEASFNKNNKYYINNFGTSTTSTFFAHYANSIEGGLIFCRNEEDYVWYLMARNHGLVRSLYPYADRLKRHPDTYLNKGVHKEFDFNVEGLNFRNTEINAYFGILDSQYWDKMIETRKIISSIWANNLDSDLYSLPLEFSKEGNVPFALPIVCNDVSRKFKVQEYFNRERIESRPIVSGSLRFQTIFKKYMKEDYPVADSLHERGLYIGLNSKSTAKQIVKIAKGLNNL